MTTGRTGNPRGRPRLTEPPITPEVRAELIDRAGKGVIDAILCRCVGIDQSTWVAWRHRKEPGFVGFFKEIDRARARRHSELLEMVYTHAETKWEAAKWALSREYPELDDKRAPVSDAAKPEGDELPAALQRMSAEGWQALAKEALRRSRTAPKASEPIDDDAPEEDDDDLDEVEDDEDT